MEVWYLSMTIITKNREGKNDHRVSPIFYLSLYGKVFAERSVITMTFGADKNKKSGTRNVSIVVCYYYPLSSFTQFTFHTLQTFHLSNEKLFSFCRSCIHRVGDRSFI